MKKWIMVFGLVGAGITPAFACLDCGDTGVDATFSGTLTVETLAGTAYTNITNSINNLQRSYEITIGTLGAQHVSIASNSVEDALNAAFDMAKCRGLVGSTTAQAKIQFFPGNYYLTVTAPFVIPAGVVVEGVSGSTAVVWVVTNLAGNRLDIHGKLKGINFDFAGAPITGMVVAVTSGTLENSRFMGTFDMTDTANGWAPLGVLNSSGAVITNVVFDRARELSQYQNLAGALLVKNSSWTTVTGLSVISTRDTFTGGGIVNVINSDWTTFDRCMFNEVTQNYMTIGTSRNTRVTNSNFVLRGTSAGSAIFLQNYADTTMYVGSSTYISGNHFYNYNTNAGTVMILLGVSNHYVFGTVVSENEALNMPGSNAGAKFYTTSDTNVRGTLFKGNTVSGMLFGSDSGVGTKLTANDNFVDGVEQ